MSTPTNWFTSPWPHTIASFLALFGTGLLITVYGPLVTSMMEHFQATEFDVGNLFGAYASGFLLTVLIGDQICRLIPIKPLTALGSLMMGGGYLWFGHSPSIGWAMVGMVFGGVGSGFIQLGGNTGISQAFPEHRAFYLNLLHSCFGFGAIIGPVLAAWSLQNFSYWGTVYRIIMGVFVLSILFALLDFFPREPLHTAAQPGASAATVEQPFWRNGTFWLLAVGISTYVGVEASVINWVPLFLEREVALSKLEAASYMSIFLLIFTLGRVLTGVLARWIVPRVLLVVLTVGTPITIACFLASPHGLTKYMSAAAMGLFFSGIFATHLALASDRFPRQLSAVTAAMMFSMGTGNLAYPWVSGLLSGKFGPWAAMYLVQGASVALAILGVTLYGVLGGRPSSPPLTTH